MPRELTIRATIPLPDDAFDAAPLIVKARPAIEALREALKDIKGATITSTFDGRSATRVFGAPASQRVARKPRAAVQVPDGVAATPSSGATERLV